MTAVHSPGDSRVLSWCTLLVTAVHIFTRGFSTVPQSFFFWTLVIKEQVAVRAAGGHWALDPGPLGLWVVNTSRCGRGGDADDVWIQPQLSGGSVFLLLSRIDGAPPP